MLGPAPPPRSTINIPTATYQYVHDPHPPMVLINRDSGEAVAFSVPSHTSPLHVPNLVTEGKKAPRASFPPKKAFNTVHVLPLTRLVVLRCREFWSGW